MEVIEINLIGGLCNKLFCLFSACDIAIKNNIKILEPNFGWKKKILFSDIYDIDFFNNEIKEFNNGENIIVPINQKNKYSIKKVNYNLWAYCENIVGEQRRENKINKNCMMIIVLQALKLNKYNENIVNSFNEIQNKNAIHIRIENDWISYSRAKNVNKKQNELYLITIDSLTDMYKQKWFTEDIFFTTGENQFSVQKKFADKDINSQFIFNNNLEYEINAAINFELCCKAKIFIGLSWSTFSNLISLKRSLINKNNSFIYNLNNEIILRIDKGLHTIPENAIKNYVNILND